MPFAPQQRHSAHSRGIHLRLPTHQPETPAASALRYGYCDFGQYDGRWHSGDRCGIQCPLRPNTVIPRAVAESISACQRTSRRRQRPWHSDMDTATSPSMTAVGIPETVAEFSALCAPTASFRAQSRNPSPHANALAGDASGLGTPHSDMDTATSPSMTAVGIPVTVAEFSALCAPTHL